MYPIEEPAQAKVVEAVEEEGEPESEAESIELDQPLPEEPVLNWVACDTCSKWRLADEDLSQIGAVRCRDLGVHCDTPDDSELSDEQQSLLLAASAAAGFRRSEESVALRSGFYIPQLTETPESPFERVARDFEESLAAMSMVTAGQYNSHYRAIVVHAYSLEGIPCERTSAAVSRAIKAFEVAATRLRPFKTAYFRNADRLREFESLFKLSDKISASVKSRMDKCSTRMDTLKKNVAAYLIHMRSFVKALANDELDIVVDFFRVRPVQVEQAPAKRHKGLRGTAEDLLATETV